MSSKPVVAVALGGLGGFNAHDAGVLAAAHECGLEPDIITCTSGAIFWTDLFLTDPGAIRDQVEQQVEAVSGANAVEVAVLGDPDVFQPAYASWWERWFSPPSGPPLRDLLDRLFPAQLYQSTRPETFLSLSGYRNNDNYADGAVMSMFAAGGGAAAGQGGALAA